MVDVWTWWTAFKFAMSSASLATLIGVGAVAVAIFTPPILARFIPHLRMTAIYVAAGAFAYTFVAGHFYHAGLRDKAAEWQAGLAREAQGGEKARSDAERVIARDTPERVRVDSANRDNWQR